MINEDFKITFYVTALDSGGAEDLARLKWTLLPKEYNYEVTDVSVTRAKGRFGLWEGLWEVTFEYELVSDLGINF